MMKVRKFSSHSSVRFALRPLHMLRFIIATFYYGEYLFYLTVRESANNSQLRNMLLFFFFFLFKFKNKGIVPEFSLSLSKKKCQPTLSNMRFLFSFSSKSGLLRLQS